MSWLKTLGRNALALLKQCSQPTEPCPECGTQTEFLGYQQFRRTVEMRGCPRCRVRYSWR